MTLQDKQVEKFFAELDRRKFETYLNKRGERKSLSKFYIINEDGSGITFTDDITKEVRKIFRELEKDYLILPYKK